MKKIVTLLMCLGIAVSAAFAAPVKTGLINNLKYQVTPEGQQRLRAAYVKAKQEYDNGADNGYTRSMVEGNRIWTVSVLLSEEKICDMVTVTDPDTGQSTKLPFDQMPYYAAIYSITSREQGNPNLQMYIFYTMCWPSQYIYQQTFTYDGPRQDGMIPESERDYSPVPMSELANNKDFTNNFKETNTINSNVISGTTKFEYWTMLENALDANGGVGICEGKEAQTVVNGDQGSTLVFNSYDKATNDLNVQGRYLWRFYPDGASVRTTRLTYNGEARVEGFEHIDQTLPEFGDLHLFNAGLGGSELFGDLNPFTGPWGPYTQLYAAIGDTHVIWDFDETAKEFDREVIKVAAIDVDDELLVDQYANLFVGYLYADAKYADTSLNPDGIFTMVDPLIDMGNETVEIVPGKNSFVPYGFNDYNWSYDYGSYFMVHNDSDLPAFGSKLGWGTTEGFKMVINNHYDKTVNAMSAGNVIYHYDPMDVQKTRVYPLVGTLEWGSGVETVMADNATITAQNGVITVVAKEACNVAIYALDGTCLKNVKAQAGATVNAEVEKGIYVVKGGETSKKVAL